MNLIMMFLLSIVLGGLVLLAAVLLLLSLKNRVVSGKEGMIGEKGIAIEDFDEKGRGMIKVRGEIWRATSETKIRKDDDVVVRSIEGLFLIVDKNE
jgi:membrane-bound serine protease (ClpP class)